MHRSARYGIALIVLLGLCAQALLTIQPSLAVELPPDDPPLKITLSPFMPATDQTPLEEDYLPDPDSVARKAAGPAVINLTHVSSSSTVMECTQKFSSTEFCLCIYANRTNVDLVVTVLLKNQTKTTAELRVTNSRREPLKIGANEAITETVIIPKEEMLIAIGITPPDGKHIAEAGEVGYTLILPDVTKIPAKQDEVTKSETAAPK